jgi:hypothetical protein
MPILLSALLLAVSRSCDSVASSQTGMQPKIVDVQVSTQSAGRDLRATLNSLGQAQLRSGLATWFPPTSHTTAEDTRPA